MLSKSLFSGLYRNSVSSFRIFVLFVWGLPCLLVIKYFGPKQEPPSPPAIPSAYPSQVAQETPNANVPSPHELPPQTASLGWPLGMSLDMHVYLTTSPTGDVFSNIKEDRGLPSFVWGNLTFGSWDENRVVDFMVDLPYVSVSPSLPYTRTPRQRFDSPYNITVRSGRTFT